MESAMNVNFDGYADPVTFHDAVNCKDSEEWIKAIQTELHSMEKWQVVNRCESDKSKIISFRWLFKSKDMGHGVRKFKARLVARGFEDDNKHELEDTYAPVSKLSTVRWLLAVSNKLNLDLMQLDVQTAFLYGDLDNLVFMKVPDMVKCPSTDKSRYVCKVVKSLYGLKNAPRQCYKKLHVFLINLGFSQSEKDPCVYFKVQGDNIIIIVVYVDDFLIAGNNSIFLQKLKLELQQKFDIHDLGEPTKYLGLEIVRNRELQEIEITQSKYIEAILERFNMSNAKSQPTPMLSTKFDLNSSSLSPNVPYRQAVGALMYLANGTRPDITFAVHYLSRFQSNPKQEHWVMVKHVFRYLRGTVNLGLKYCGKIDGISAYADSDFASDLDSRKSTSGLVVCMFGDPIVWSSRKQECIALSTTEAEYVAMTEAAREIVFIHALSSEIKIPISLPITLFEDNTSAIKLSKTLENKRTKHVEVKYHFIRKLVADKFILPVHIKSEHQTADILTKPLEKNKLRVLRSNLVHTISSLKASAEHKQMSK